MERLSAATAGYTTSLGMLVEEMFEGYCMDYKGTAPLLVCSSNKQTRTTEGDQIDRGRRFITLHGLSL